MGKKVQVELSKKDQGLLKALQDKTYGTAATVIREALAAYNAVAQETEKGGEIFVKKGDTETKLVFPGLPHVTIHGSDGLQTPGPYRSFWKRQSLEIKDTGVSPQSIEILRKEFRGFRLGDHKFIGGRDSDVQLELLFSFDPENPHRIRNIFKREWDKRGTLIVSVDVTSGQVNHEQPCERPFRVWAWDAQPDSWRVHAHVYGDLFLVVSISGNCGLYPEKV